MTEQPAIHSAKGTRLNRKGLETRQLLLRAAVRCLADGGPEAVSANLIAQHAGVTWGTVQHQFGDVDGLWAAVLEFISHDAHGPLSAPPPESLQLVDRVDAILRMLGAALDFPASRAVYNLRGSLPRDRGELESAFPRTAAAMAGWETDWTELVSLAFAGLDVDAEKLDRVRSLLPGAMRGLQVEESLGTYIDSGEARRGLREAITAYLA